MFDQLVKRSNAVWTYKTGRFAEERRTFLCHLNERRHVSLATTNIFAETDLAMKAKALGASEPGGGEPPKEEVVTRSEPNGVLAKDLKASLRQILPWPVDGRAMENVALHPRIAV